ncbi:MAG TPA: hypothetical protein VKD71_05770, partial [Gemmataceae bacterium]|nr:hypothetical protein [Gemmataceae bacterium]
PIPMPRTPVAVSPHDLDAMAAAAFSDQPVEQQAGGEMIAVTCSACDHAWTVEANKEGKNVLCPECRRPNRVPMRKKQEKADWRTGGGPSMAKKETGLDREGAFGTVGMGGISDDTAREIVKSREAEEEPEERRKKLIKRSVIALVVIAVVGAGGYYLFKSRKEAVAEQKMEDAVKELTEATKDKDPKLEAIIFRASGEYRSRAAGSEKEAKDALLDLQKARNKAKAIKGSDADRNIILAEVAITFTELMGTTEQVDKGARMKKDALLGEFRQTLQSITDPDATAEAIRGITRKLAADGHPTMAEEFTHQLAKPDELVGQIGLELLRLNRDAYRQQAEELLKKVSTNEAPSIQALRLVLNKPFAPKKGEAAPATSPVAQAESAALAGDFERAMRVSGKPEEKARALAAAANVAIETNPSKATEMLKAAADLLKGEAKGLVSPIVVARVCRQLTQLGLDNVAESLAGSQPDEPSKGWARLGVLRGRLMLSKDKKAEDSWLDMIGDPAKLAPAAKAREEIARHNAANGQDYQATVKSWPSGSVRPFGTAGLVLGKQDRK